ncbi:hypothetical protein D3C80_949180 [compost metagenome]
MVPTPFPPDSNFAAIAPKSSCIADWPTETDLALLPPFSVTLSSMVLLSSPGLWSFSQSFVFCQPRENVPASFFSNTWFSCMARMIGPLRNAVASAASGMIAPAPIRRPPIPASLPPIFCIFGLGPSRVKRPRASRGWRLALSRAMSRRFCRISSSSERWRSAGVGELSTRRNSPS